MAYRYSVISEARLTSKNRGRAIFSTLLFRLKRLRLERLDTFEPVGIKCGKGLPSTAGVLKDISRNGARITLFQAAKLPKLVEIEFQLLGLSVQAHIRWHRKNDIGVQFEKPIDLDQTPFRLRRSRTEIVASYFKSNRAGPKKAG
jgi:hypothetical protein